VMHERRRGALCVRGECPFWFFLTFIRIVEPEGVLRAHGAQHLVCAGIVLEIGEPLGEIQAGAYARRGRRIYGGLLQLRIFPLSSQSIKDTHFVFEILCWDGEGMHL
jgi:hypothetical protein